MRYINGFDDTEIVAGAGTMGMEMLEQVRAETRTKRKNKSKTRKNERRYVNSRKNIFAASSLSRGQGQHMVERLFHTYSRRGRSILYDLPVQRLGVHVAMECRTVIPGKLQVLNSWCAYDGAAELLLGSCYARRCGQKRI